MFLEEDHLLMSQQASRLFRIAKAALGLLNKRDKVFTLGRGVGEVHYPAGCL